MSDKPQMTPGPGERLLRFVGDRVRIAVRGWGGAPLPEGWSALVRTNLGRAAILRDEIIRSHSGRLPVGGASWRDIPLTRSRDEWVLDVPLTEVGYFRAKAYAVDARGRQYWPDGPDLGISVHPDEYRTGNTIYCAFPRLFGDSRFAARTIQESLEAQLGKLDKQGYTVIPPSGKLRDLTRELPHILETLGCRVLHLLPVTPTPATYARFGRYGSPYATQDLMAVDPALVEFDRRTTGIDQFKELAYSVHSHGARLFLDVVVNHTGWGSPVQENHPDWFLKDANGHFQSPGAWGVTWEDLVELDHRDSAPWDYFAEVFLTWRRRGVDGFRCDAGYKVPTPAWRYIIARVRQEFPDTIFLLEGLGGSWEATDLLLSEGGMQWAYSELFQNYSGAEVAAYLDYALRQSSRAGIYVHYSETHDNDRLAARGRAWSLMRNSLCALTSVNGAYGFTCGVEWLAPEKINVHSCRGLAWNSEENLVRELAGLNRLLRDHPCFQDGAVLTRVSPDQSPVYALLRQSCEGLDHLLVLVNTDVDHAQEISIPKQSYEQAGKPRFDLLAGRGEMLPGIERDRVVFKLGAGASCCLADAIETRGLAGEAYREARQRAAWALTALGVALPMEGIASWSWTEFATRAGNDPERFLASVSSLEPELASRDLAAAFERVEKTGCFSNVIVWRWPDQRRVTPVPPGHWLLLLDDSPFRAVLRMRESELPVHVQSIRVREGFAACFPPTTDVADATLCLERYGSEPREVSASIRFLSAGPQAQLRMEGPFLPRPDPLNEPLVLLTNGRGGMSRMAVDLGRVKSKYDCVLGANLHPNVPIDRHVFVKRARVWVNADRFISPLDLASLARFEPGPPARWTFVANAGDGRTVEILLEADMLDGKNTVVFRFYRLTDVEAVEFRASLPHGRGQGRTGSPLPAQCDVRLTVRLDLEDRNFHWETKRGAGAEHHFAAHTRPLAETIGFEFTPVADRVLRVFADRGRYQHEAEWSVNLAHPVEQTRGQEGFGDAFSPGWFDLPLGQGESACVVISADAAPPDSNEVLEFASERRIAAELHWRWAHADDDFTRQLVRAARGYVVQRGKGKTVVAGYPWFLDWGRDSLICCRGLLAAGMAGEVEQLLTTFGRFEENGTLPNSIHGEDASNRDTSDAPLWFGLVCEEAAQSISPALYDRAVDSEGRILKQVLVSIAEGYLRGTRNGIQVDPASGLVWSPPHFTWMDTNYPAATSRCGYPIEIQVLWIRMLKQLDRLKLQRAGESWGTLAARAGASVEAYYWLEPEGWFADSLIAAERQPAARATVDRALRSNCLFAIALGLIGGEKARSCVSAAQRHLVVPGALRSLAPLPASPPHPVYGNHGELLNNPSEPYWGRYEGDEDTRRKAAYHNGTAWTWTFPTFCEALARAWDLQPRAVAAAKAYLGSMDRLLNEVCLGHMPEIVDGDAPHQQRGCDAQAWGATEALRVWKWLQSVTGNTDKKHETID